MKKRYKKTNNVYFKFKNLSKIQKDLSNEYKINKYGNY